MKVCSLAALSQHLAALSQCLKVSWLMLREAGAEGNLCLGTLLKVLLSLARSCVLLVSVHVTPLGSSRRFHKIVPQQSSSLSIPGRVPFCNGQVQFLQIPAQPVISW